MRDQRWLRATARVTASMLAAGALFLGNPGHVAATMTGGGAFDATLTLQTFPCPSFTCGGSATGTASLSLSGVGTATVSGVPLPFTAAWTPTVSVLNAAITYGDTCELDQPDGTVPLSGNGGGTFTLSGGSVVLGGGVLTPATLSGTINFDRIANAMVMSLSSLSITPPAGSPVIAINENNGALVGQVAAAIIWTNGPGTCPVSTGQVTNQTAILAGLTVQPA